MKPKGTIGTRGTGHAEQLGGLVPTALAAERRMRGALINRRYGKTFCSYLTENTVCLHQKQQSAIIVAIKICVYYQTNNTNSA